MERIPDSGEAYDPVLMNTIIATMVAPWRGGYQTQVKRMILFS
jgi:hypothetical protein